MGVALIQPKWGKTVSSAHGALPPSTASLLTALIAKLIETSFVAVFVASVGQILTKKAFDVGNRGVTLGEFGMKNWVVVSLRHDLFASTLANCSQVARLDVYEY